MQFEIPKPILFISRTKASVWGILIFFLKIESSSNVKFKYHLNNVINIIMIIHCNIFVCLITYTHHAHKVGALYWALNTHYIYELSCNSNILC